MTVDILIGDVMDQLAGLPDNHFDVVVTSPPYWGLRDYGAEGQMGLEPTLAEHIAKLVEVFAEVHRVLKPHGSVWLNYGDCYATTPNGRSAADTKAAASDDRTFRDKPFSTVGPICATGSPSTATRSQNGKNPKGQTGNTMRIMAGGSLKPGDLCMIPQRLAIALQDWGWWVRSEITWGKPNPMPDSSGAYRPSDAHEKIFMLAKSGKPTVWRARDTGELSFTPDRTERCAFKSADGEGCRWIGMATYYDALAVRVERASREDSKAPDGWDTDDGAHGTVHHKGRQKGAKKPDKQRGHSRRHQGFNGRCDAMTKAEQQANGRLRRNYEPAPPQVWEFPVAGFKQAHFATFPPELVARCLRAALPPGGRVLDPFGGAGTTGLVAAEFGADCTLIELNPDYAQLASERLAAGLVPLAKSPLAADLSGLTLFGEVV